MKTPTNQLFSRDGIFKTYNNEGYRAEAALVASVNLADLNTSSTGVLNTKSPLSSLYQKVQKEVLSNKLTRAQPGIDQNRGATPISGSSLKKQVAGAKPTSHSNATSLLQAGRRDETPKGISHRIMLNSHYNSNNHASPDHTLEKYSAVNLSSTASKLTKKSSTRALDVVSPAKKAALNEKGIVYMSYDGTQTTGLKSAAFKLDLGKSYLQQRYVNRY